MLQWHVIQQCAGQRTTSFMPGFFVCFYSTYAHMDNWLKTSAVLFLPLTCIYPHDHRDNKCGVQKHDFCLASGL